MQDRRTESRMLCADMLDVCWRDERGRNQKGTAILEDISRSGACLQFEKPVPQGVAIRWDSGKKAFQGRVRYCMYREFGYFVGIEFDAQSKWSKKAFRPQHMLDLATLVKRAKS